MPKISTSNRRPCVTSFAAVDPPLTMLPLFRPLPRQGRTEARNHNVVAEKEFGGRRISVESTWTLGADDLSALLVVCALAGMDGKVIEPSKQKVLHDGVVTHLNSKGDATDVKHLRLVTTMDVMIREVGLEHRGDSYKQVRASLKRLARVTYTDYGPVGSNMQSMRATGSQNLLDVVTEENEVHIMLNAWLTAAIIPGGQFSRIDLNESRTLKGEAARILHFYLSSIVRAGQQRDMELDTIVDRLYDRAAKSQRQLLNRRGVARQALKEIGGLDNWTISIKREAVHITRQNTTRKAA